jgi:hypothetical protein
LVAAVNGHGGGDIGIVRVGVSHRRVGMRMAVRFTRRIAGAMLMLVMFVVDVAMIVGHWFVGMFMLMLLC